MPWDFWLILLFLATFMPWRGRRRMRPIMSLEKVTSKDRLRLYIPAIFFQWVLTVLIAWRALARGLTRAELGISSDFGSGVILFTVVGTAVIASLHWLNLRKLGSLDIPAAQRFRKMAARLFPATRREIAVFCFLALTAGVCEEFIFRGFVLAALTHAGVSAWLTVLISSAMFGFAHLYQGRRGIVGTGVLGIAFGIARIAYDSLLPVTVWHTALDLVAGLVGPRYLAQDPVETTAVEPSEGIRA